MPAVKVKSHQALDPQASDFWMRLGNAVADLAATTAHMELGRPLTSQLMKLQTEQSLMHHHLKQQLEMRADLVMMRSRLLKDDMQYVDPDEKLSRLYNWTVQDPQQFLVPHDLNYVAHASR